MAGALPELDFAGAFDPIANQTNLLKFQALQQTLPGDIAATNAESGARAAIAPLKAAEETALSPLRIKEETALSPLRVQAAQRADQAGQLQAGEQGMGAVARSAAAADPGDAAAVWDDGMRKLADQGVPGATQYIGHYRPDLAERVGDMYGTVKPPAPPAGFDPEQTARAVAAMPPADRAKSLKNLTSAVTGYDRVRDEDGWNEEVAALRQAGLPVDSVLTPGANWQMNYMAVRPLIDRFRATIPMLQGAVSSDTMGAPNAQPKPLYEPSYQYVGVDASTGRPIYHDPHSNQEVMGANPMGAKPNSAVAAFQFKLQAALQSGMDQQAALNFANGKRNLSPAQLQDMALAQANRELSALVLNGTAPANPDQWLRQKAAENMQMLTNAGGAPGSGGGPKTPAATGALPQRAIDVLKKAGGKPVRFNNGMTYKMGPDGKPVRVP